MAEYTVELRQILMSYLPPPKISNAQFQSQKEIIENGSPYLFDFDYPFYSDVEDDRIEFEHYFCRHYYMYEIGQETVGLFKSRLQSKLYDVMPEIKRIYDTERMTFDPLNDYSEIRQYTTEDTGEQTNNVTSDRRDTSNAQTDSLGETSEKLFTNDTPQGELSDIDTGKYLSQYTSRPTTNESSDRTTGENTSEITNSGEDTIHNIQTHTETISGKHGQQSYMELIQQYRNLAVNVNLELCKRLHDMFLYIM